MDFLVNGIVENRKFWNENQHLSELPPIRLKWGCSYIEMHLGKSSIEITDSRRDTLKINTIQDRVSAFMVRGEGSCVSSFNFNLIMSDSDSKDLPESDGTIVLNNTGLNTGKSSFDSRVAFQNLKTLFFRFLNPWIDNEGIILSDGSEFKVPHLNTQALDNDICRAIASVADC